MTKIIAFSFIALFFSACSLFETEETIDLKNSTLTIDQLVAGWPEMLSEIKAESGNIAALSGRKFNLRIVLEGSWNLNITPQNAFRIERGSQENLFTATIVNPFVLFDNLGGLSKMTYVQAELSKAGGEQGAIELSSRVECMYRVRFFQKNGSLVDFNQISAAYDYDFVISPSDSLSIHSMTSTSVQFARSQNFNDEASVQVRLVSKNQKEVYLSNQVRVPKCHESLVQSEAQKINQHAGLCLRHLQTQGVKLESNRELTQSLREVFGNNCDRGIKCTMTARYGLLRDQKIIQAQDKEFVFQVRPQEYTEIDASFTYPAGVEFDSKLYLGGTLTKEATPINYEPAQYKPVVCEWVKGS